MIKMKKLISASISFLLAVTTAGVSASAAEASVEKDRLKVLIDFFDTRFNTLGGASIYDNNTYTELRHAKEVYNDINSTDSDYSYEYSKLLQSDYNGVISPAYARSVAKNALSEKNYNNWYSEEEWQLYQEKAGNLNAAVENYTSVYSYYGEPGEDGAPIVKTGYEYSNEQKQVINTAFHEYIYTLNSIAEQNWLKGDVNGDGHISISDATTIQLYLCELSGLTIPQKMRAYLTESEDKSANLRKITIRDVTELQKYLVSEFDDFDNLKTVTQEIDSYENTEFLKGHFLNRFVCPGRVDAFSPALPDGYYITSDLQNFYRYCEEHNIDYNV